MASQAFPCRLILDPPAAGPWNMAVDEALLAAATESEVPVLRFYQWQRPTLSLGYFQRYADRASHPPSLEADVVRRLSGGGAILHDRELTYSLILPRTHPLARDTQALYDKVHQAIVQLLDNFISQASVPWQLVLCETTSTRDRKSEPFLCFQRRSRGDVLLRSMEPKSNVAEYKIVGSAQRRRHGDVLQHGSILLAQSEAAPELLGFSHATGRESPTRLLTASLPLNFSEALHFNMEESRLPESIQVAAQKLLQRRYSSHDWTKRR